MRREPFNIHQSILLYGIRASYPTLKKELLKSAKLRSFRNRCESAPVISNQQYRFYDVLVDDFTRFGWIYPLKRNFDFFAQFMIFKNLWQDDLTPKL